MTGFKLLPGTDVQQDGLVLAQGLYLVAGHDASVVAAGEVAGDLLDLGEVRLGDTAQRQP
jgi:hypothetical protein